jgi:hypothetical protein
MLLTMAAAAPRPATTGVITEIKSPQVPNGTLAAQSCPAAGACEAVGSYHGPVGAALTLAEMRDGSAWHVQPTPNPAHAHGSTLAAISCQSTDACTAVGSSVNSADKAATLTEFWNGTAWHIQPSPNPAGSFGSYLTGVSCTAADACTAVGYWENQDFEDTAVGFAESWDGQTWTIQQMPNTGLGPVFLYAVSCTSATACVATGQYNGNANGGLPFAAIWNGTSWSAQPPVVPNGGFTSLTGVSCTSATTCTVVGNYSQSHKPFAELTLAETWNGTTWTIQPTPNAAGWGDLNAVSCTSPTACTAVGWGTQQEQPLAEVWDGATWTAQAPAQPPGAAQTPLAGVSCPAQGACLAVGNAFFNDPSAWQTLTEAESGSTWTIQPSPSPAGALGATLSGISCPAATSCAAVGSVAESWNGTTWTHQAIARPSGAVTVMLRAVSCTAASACLAVGSYSDASRADHALAESWNGSRWRLVPPAEPAGATSAVLNGVSCTSASACLAVGGSGGKTLAESWNGTSWSLQTTVDPSTQGNELLGVTCLTASDCTAVGDTRNGPLAEDWNGSTWSQQATPRSGATLLSVSCTSASACIAVGSGGAGSVVAAWNGTAWTIKHLAPPAGTFEAQLNSLSCTSARACTAVGYADQDNPEIFRVPTAAVWNGTTWAVEPAADPSHASVASLSGIACGVVGGCLAVGSHGWIVRQFGVDVPFAEQGL